MMGVFSINELYIVARRQEHDGERLSEQRGGGSARSEPASRTVQRVRKQISRRN
jgi:hypothetical protein